MNILTIPYYSDLDNTLEELWKFNDNAQGSKWGDFLKDLDKNIIDVSTSHRAHTTSITFRKPEHITWFIMRWS